MKNGFAVLGIILGIVISAFIVGGAAYLYFRSTKSEPTTPDRMTEEPTPEQSPTDAQEQQTPTRQNYRVVYGLYSESDGKYKLFAHDLANNAKQEFYSVSWKKNFAGPALAKYDENTILFSQDIGEGFLDIGEGFLIDLNGKKVEGRFVPPSTLFSHSPDRKKLIYHAYPAGRTTARLRDLGSGKDVPLYFSGEGQISQCISPIWRQDSSAAYCHDTQAVYLVTAADGRFTKVELDIPGDSGFYPEQNLIFRIEATPGQGDAGPPASLIMLNTETRKETTLLRSEDKMIVFVGLSHSRKDVIFLLDDGLYVAKLDDVKNTMKKIISGGYIESFAEDSINIVFRKTDPDERDPFTDTIIATDIYGSDPVELYTFNRSLSPEAKFVGWFKK